MEYKIKRSFLKDQGIIYTVYFKDGKRYVVASRHKSRGDAIQKLSFLMARDNSSLDLTQVSKNFCVSDPIKSVEEIKNLLQKDLWR